MPTDWVPPADFPSWMRTMEKRLLRQERRMGSGVNGIITGTGDPVIVNSTPPMSKAWNTDYALAVAGEDLITGLTWVPLPGSLHVRWVPYYTPVDNWSLSGNVLTVEDLGHWHTGDRFEFAYLYDPTQSPPPTYVPPPPPVPSGILIDFEDPTWRHLQVIRTDTVDYSSPSFDDSAWPVDPAAFGDYTSPAPYPSWPTYTTLWNRNSKMWVRRAVTTAPGQDVIITARWDRYLRVYWNGVDQTGSLNSTTSGATPPLVIPGASVSGTDLLAISITDDGWTGAGTGNCYFDVRVEQ